MMKVTTFVLFLASIPSISLQDQIPLLTLPGNETEGCLTQQHRDDVHQTIRESVLATVALQLVRECGGELWTRIVYLNMSDPMQSCPPAWRDRSANGVRVCGRPASSHYQCHSTFYHADYSYTRVCGQVIAYQFGSPDGFHVSTIDFPYVDGVSITHGHSPRSHIWTFAADGYEASNNCPCEGGQSAPPFVGNNYYCGSGYNGTDHPSSVLYSSDPLWDGVQCESEGSCCSTAPWFTVDLVNPTSDDIEVRICSDSNDGEEDTPIHLLELYTQ